jgi:hypothetical protein
MSAMEHEHQEMPVCTFCVNDMAQRGYVPDGRGGWVRKDAQTPTTVTIIERREGTT